MAHTSKSQIFALVFGLFIVSASAHSQDNGKQCPALIKEYWKKMRVTLESGNLSTAPDDDNDTLQVILVKELPNGTIRISDDGQIVYTSLDAISKGNSAEVFIKEALVRKIMVSNGTTCLF